MLKVAVGKAVGSVRAPARGVIRSGLPRVAARVAPVLGMAGRLGLERRLGRSGVCRWFATVEVKNIMLSKTIKTSSLTPLQFAIIMKKATEPPGTGALTDMKAKGTYLCRNCGTPLFKDTAKFMSGCGWPSFDEEIPGSVERVPDADGRRTEIVCGSCKGHLGHVFHGEGFTKKNTRHCVNSASIDFVPFTDFKTTDEVILAAGCFWGVEYLLKKLPGVLLTEVGYSGGKTQNPTYKEVCYKNTGHLEVVRVIFDPEKLDLSKLLKYFLEIHDPFQKDGQGPDIGEQYLSAIFYYNPEQKKVAEEVLGILSSKGKQAATTVRPAAPFYIGEEYHRDYYEKKGTEPYCHRRVKRFDN